VRIGPVLYVSPEILRRHLAKIRPRSGHRSQRDSSVNTAR